MSTIVTLTLNPALDKSASFSGLVPDKKIRCSSPSFAPGGGGVNVARVITRLGGKALAIYPSGGHTGQFFNQLLEKEDVGILPVPVENYTRENLVVLDKETNLQYRFGMPGSILKDKDWHKCIELIEKQESMDFLVASGSLAPGIPLEIYADIAKLVKKKGSRLILDTSGDALKHGIKEGVYLLKPNLGELASLVGIEFIDPVNVKKIAQEMIASGSCEIMVVSMGEKGAALITRDQYYEISPPKVERKSTVGAGDSMVAGIVLGISQERSLFDSLMYGVACGTAATMHPGTELCHPEEVNALYSSMKSSLVNKEK